MEKLNCLPFQTDVGYSYILVNTELQLTPEKVGKQEPTDTDNEEVTSTCQVVIISSRSFTCT